MFTRGATDKAEMLDNDFAIALRRLDKNLSSLPPSLLILSALAVGSSTALAGTFLYRRFFRRFPNSEWITPDVLAKKKWIKGYVTSVGDNDNFRLYHTPAFGWAWPLKFRRIPTKRDLKDQTIHIRLAGIDAPEGAHFGRPGQPYAAEALAWLKGQVDGKTVYCQLIRKDQYSRIVAIPHLKPRLLPGFLGTGTCVSLEMLRAGWAITYEQAGAEYGRWGKEEFLRLQAEAQAARRGMWSKGITGETPTQYKRRYANSVEGAEIADESANNSKRTNTTPRSWWARLWPRL